MRDYEMQGMVQTANNIERSKKRATRLRQKLNLGFRQENFAYVGLAKDCFLKLLFGNRPESSNRRPEPPQEKP